MKARYDSPCVGCKKTILVGAEMRYLGPQQSYHIGCVPSRQAGVKNAPLPTERTQGDGSYVHLTYTDWVRIRDRYRDAGVSAEITVPPRWKQYALVIGGRVRVNTSIDKGRGARRRGAKAIHIVQIDEAGNLVGGRTKVLRRDGWRGRVLERVNDLLRASERWSHALAT